MEIKINYNKQCEELPTDSMGFLKTNGQDFRYNEPFRVIGVQIMDIDNNIVGVYGVELLDKKDQPRIYKKCLNRGQWIIRKEEISDLYCDFFRKMRLRSIPKDVVRFIIKPILGGPEIVMR